MDPNRLERILIWERATAERLAESAPGHVMTADDIRAVKWLIVSLDKAVRNRDAYHKDARGYREKLDDIRSILES